MSDQEATKQIIYFDALQHDIKNPLPYYKGIQVPTLCYHCGKCNLLVYDDYVEEWYCYTHFPNIKHLFEKKLIY